MDSDFPFSAEILLSIAMVVNAIAINTVNFFFA